ncbi:hypothetical protein [Vitreimonas sp.]|uniref:hypothetical protein n=1 Tax=Vitreimonas sp. TaxID=3069702 RepID=UPI002ED8775A
MILRLWFLRSVKLGQLPLRADERAYRTGVPLGVHGFATAQGGVCLVQQRAQRLRAGHVFRSPFQPNFSTMPKTYRTAGPVG